MLTLTFSQALHRSNLDLVTDAIETVTESGIRTADGTEHELDVIILATGFNLVSRELDLGGVRKTWADDAQPPSPRRCMASTSLETMARRSASRCAT